MPGALDVRVLGPLEVRRQGAPLRLGGATQRALFALLALRQGEVVSSDALVDALWGESPPTSARSMVQVYISRLRKLLDNGASIQSRAGGYVLDLDAEQLDLRRFERSIDEGKAAQGRGENELALARLDDALRLWRGDPLEGLDAPGLPMAQINALVDLRVSALESRFDAAIELGRHDEVVPELPPLLQDNPLNERLHSIAMLVLYRAGRQSEALELASALRQRLSSELGIEPSRAVQQLERRILSGDATLDAPQTDQEPSPIRRSRKIVPAIVAALRIRATGESRLDPELSRTIVEALTDVARGVIERHGGRMERSLPKTLIGVFGLPSSHEDDASRAVRAAIELRDALLEIAVGGHASAADVDIRVGVAADEVLVESRGVEQELLSAAPVELATQLVQQARPGEVLLTQTAFRLAQRDVGAEPTELLLLPDDREPTVAYRLVSVLPEHSPRRLRSELVGREGEMSALMESFERVAREKTCSLVTVMGLAGVGKSRLVSEFLGTLGNRAHSAIGQCVSYGRDITFLPAAEIIRRLVQVVPGEGSGEVRARIEATFDEDQDRGFLADQLMAVMGLGESAPASDELFWSIRRLLEVQARRRPLVVVFEDIHWAEPKLLDLIEHIAAWSRDAPMLLVCLARPELIEARPGWGGGNLPATTLSLESLAREEARRLIDNLLGHTHLAEGIPERLMDAADGHPLFLEELLAMFIDDGMLVWQDVGWTPSSDLTDVPIPLTVQALLGSRLDRLPPDERRTIERAALIGREFSERDLREFAGGEEGLGEALGRLAQKNLIVPDRLSRTEGRTYRFRHILVRDVAYHSTPKEVRAEDHATFGTAVERATGRQASEIDEMAGYHLEAAHRYRTELGARDEQAAELASRAADRLAAAGGRAFDLDDMPAASSLLNRALRLLDDRDDRRVEILWRLGVALFESGDLDRSEEVVVAGLEAAEREHNEAFQWRLRLDELEIAFWRRPGSLDAEDSLRLAREAVEAFRRLDDHSGIARAYRMIGDLLSQAGRYEEGAQAYRSGHEAAAIAGDERELAERQALGVALGPLPTGPGIELALPMFEQGRRTNPERGTQLAYLYSLVGRREEAHDLFDEGLALAAELGNEWRSASIRTYYASALLLEGEPESAEAVVRPAVDALQRMGEKGMMSTAVGLLAQALSEQGKNDEAMLASRRSEEACAEDDVASLLLWHGARAKVLAARGEFAAAERLGREGVGIATGSDLLPLCAAMHRDLAVVLDASGNPNEAVEEMGRALQLFDRKGAEIPARRTRRDLERLRRRASTRAPGGAA
jgi:DNA-binding SARP family transcriptional activator/tetratricopeptide (TPR) repeat protein